ncbi:MAG: hypothetical protein B6242_09950 [Anaerolineaceae bacterium 4572_78]|nr:MAG: hypothetical protein B6242_09950 [Anaerolineaceae bacterium 4572_78]
MNKQSNIILDGTLIAKLRVEIQDLFLVTNIKIPSEAKQGVIIFQGDLRLDDSEVVYDAIAKRWLPLDYTPMLQRNQNQIELIANPGVVHPKPSNPLINLVLFILTVLSVLGVSLMNEGINPLENPAGILQGLPFTIAFLAILGAHEFGHYFLARYHKVAVTLPYFIPFPNIIGTFGAFIQLRSPTITRKQLFDVGVAGPIAGLVIALPVLVIGLFNSTIEPLPTVGGGYLMEGNSIFYWGLKLMIFGQALPSNGMDVFLHPLAWAGWLGLLVTMLNLVPVGQLDGGHIAYVLFGKATRTIGYVIIILMLIGSYFSLTWLFWALLIFVLVGVGHPPPLNEVAPLDNQRKLLGYVMLVVFILLFTPIPLELVGV